MTPRLVQSRQLIVPGDVEFREWQRKHPQIAGGAETLAQARAVNSGAGVTSKTLAFSGAVTAGNLLVVGTLSDTTSAVTFGCSDSVNGTYTSIPASVNHTNHSSALFYFPNTASGTPTVTGTISVSNFLILIIAEFSGCATSSPLDTGATPAAAASGNSTAPACTLVTGTDSCMIVGVCYSDTTGVVGAGFTATADDANGNQGEYKVQTTAGSLSVAYTMATGLWSVSAAAFKALVTSGPDLNAQVIN